MNQLQESKNSSNKPLVELFNANESIIAALPGALPLVTQFKKNCTQIDVLAAKQGVNKSGLKDLKETLGNALIVGGLDLSKRLIAYATINENPMLLKEAKVTETELRRLPDTLLTSKIMALLTLAENNAGDVVEFGVTTDYTDNLSNTLNAYAQAVPQPRMGIDEIKQITGELSAMFKNNDVILHKLDVLNELISAENSAFYNSYKSLRKVVVLGRGTLAMRILVKDAVTGAGLPRVKILIETFITDGQTRKPGSELAKGVKITAARGRCNIKSLPEGTYTLTFSKLGYTSEVLTVNVVAGELCSVEISLASN